MKLHEFNCLLEQTINPHIYRYEHDRKSKLYYYSLFKPNLKCIIFTIAERTFQNDKECRNRLKSIKERYDK